MSDFPDFSVYCGPACEKAWGKPDRITPKGLRWDGNDAYSVRTFDTKKCAWYDFGAKRGGSTLELARFVKGREPLKNGLRGAQFFEAWQDAFDLEYVPMPPPKKKGGGLPIIATYPYSDGKRGLLFEVVRFDTNDPLKRFKQRRPDGKGGWIWKVKGTRIVLYRLPGLIAATKANQRVLICEGEKDCNTAVRLGYAATTMPGGVEKWRKEFDEFLRGADVVVVSDNDAQLKDKKTGAPMFHPDGRPMLPGQDHAAAIARRLRKVAAQVRMIIPPTVKDLSDWVAAGGTREALDALIAQAPDLVKRPPEPEPPPPLSGPDLLDKLNAKHAVIIDGGRTLVLRFDRIEYTADNMRDAYDAQIYLRPNDYKTFYVNRRVRISEDETMPLGHWWFAHSMRRQYAGLVYEPGAPAIVGDKLNLWRGWGVEPKPGDWTLMKRHIKEVLCAGAKPVYDYYFRWMAWAVQHPNKPSEVAPVFIGERGTGKGTLGKALCIIFGQHARHVSSADHLTGHFNSHLRQCSFLFADEALAPKDKAAEGALKRMITEPTLPIEHKGRDRIEVPNCLHIMLASNNEWVIPAGMHERRFVVQKVADTQIQNAKWFGPLYAELERGGYGAMLYDLLNFDLGDWHPRQIVRTAALAEQQLQSVSPLDEWWRETLRTGVLVGAISYE